MSDTPSRPKLTANPTMVAAAKASTPTFGGVKRKPNTKLEQNTRLGHVFWCDFSPYNWPPEFDDRHLVVVIRGGVRADGAHLVVPLTSKTQDGQFAYKLNTNPNPRSASDSWAVCDHIYTVASERLEQLRDDNNHYRRSVSIDDDDLKEIGRRVFAALNSLRHHVFGPIQKPPA
jgi:mRNA interferase MazF